MITNNHLWGESWDIYRDKQVWVVGFWGQKGGRSSWHSHSHMANHFFVVSGIMNYHDDARVFRTMRPGESCYANPSLRHEFAFLEDTEGIETYYALPGHEIDPNDIVRLSPGRAPDAAPA